jgi:hypothetical protein
VIAQYQERGRPGELIFTSAQRQQGCTNRAAGVTWRAWEVNELRAIYRLKRSFNFQLVAMWFCDCLETRQIPAFLPRRQRPH